VTQRPPGEISSRRESFPQSAARVSSLYGQSYTREGAVSRPFQRRGSVLCPPDPWTRSRGIAARSRGGRCFDVFLTASGRVPGYRGASRILQGGHLIARAEHGLDRRETVRRPSGTRVKGTGMRAGDVSGGGVFGVFRRCQRARVTATNPTMLHGRPVNFRTIHSRRETVPSRTLLTAVPVLYLGHGETRETPAGKR